MITKSKLSVFLERDKVYQTIVYDYQQQDDSKSKGSLKSKVYFQGLIPTKDLARVSPWLQAIFDRDPFYKGHHKWSLEQGRQYYQAARKNTEQGYNNNIEYFTKGTIFVQVSFVLHSLYPAHSLSSVYLCLVSGG